MFYLSKFQLFQVLLTRKKVEMFHSFQCGIFVFMKTEKHIVYIIFTYFTTNNNAYIRQKYFKGRLIPSSTSQQVRFM